LAVAALTSVTRDELSLSAYLLQFAMTTAMTAILALTMCGAPSRDILVILSRFSESRAGLIAQFAFAITMATSLSKRMICCSNLMNGEDQQSKWKTSMCKMERQNMCGGEQSLRSKGFFFSNKICQYLGDKRSFIKIGSLRNFQKLLQVSFPRECANMHSHSEMFTKGFLNLISGLKLQLCEARKNQL